MKSLDTLDWSSLSRDLDAEGAALAPSLLSVQECKALAALYDEDASFRSHVIMARHGFGQGEYRYFAYPLPDLVKTLRSKFYNALVPIANRWNESLGTAARFPATHAEYLQQCHSAGQSRPTPLLLAYGPGDHNCLHQDVYGDHIFPLQVAILLSEPQIDFTGGEFVLTEQRPRMQSRVQVADLTQGDA